jgi:hypothetical protein
VNDVAPVFGLLCILVIVILIVAAFVSSNSQNRAALATVAKKWKGRVEPGGFLDYDEAILPMGDAFARLYFSKRGKTGRNTHLSVSFPDPQLRLELYSVGLIQQLRKLLGMHDIEIGSRGFDEAFIITGNNRELISEYLTAAAQAAIVELANFSTIFTADLHLSISGGNLRVTKHSTLSSAGELMRFVALTEIMFQALAYGRNPGIEFIVTAPPPVVHETACQVCGEALTANVVNCASCKTPHHLDCWQYFGSCAVYGCGQKRYVSGKRAS